MREIASRSPGFSDLGLSFRARAHYTVYHKVFEGQNPYSTNCYFPDTDEGKLLAQAAVSDMNGRCLVEHGSLPSVQLSVGRLGENQPFLRFIGDHENYDAFNPPMEWAIVRDVHIHDSELQRGGKKIMEGIDPPEREGANGAG